MQKRALVFAGISGFTAVMLGALGAHALSNLAEANSNPNFTAKSMHAYETAVHYQMLHTLAIVALVALGDKYTALGKAAITLFMIGIILFSGSIYLLVAGDITGINLKIFGPLTPIGGLFLMAGWATIFIGALRMKKIKPDDTLSK